MKPPAAAAVAAANTAEICATALAAGAAALLCGARPAQQRLAVTIAPKLQRGRPAGEDTGIRFTIPAHMCIRQVPALSRRCTGYTELPGGNA